MNNLAVSAASSPSMMGLNWTSTNTTRGDSDNFTTSPIVVRFQRRLDTKNHGHGAELWSSRQQQVPSAETTTCVLAAASLISTGGFDNPSARTSMSGCFALSTPSSAIYTPNDRSSASVPSSARQNHQELGVASNVRPPLFPFVPPLPDVEMTTSSSFLPSYWPPVTTSSVHQQQLQQGFLKPRSLQRRLLEDEEWAINTVESRPVVTAKIVYGSPAPAVAAATTTTTNHPAGSHNSSLTSTQPVPPPPPVNEAHTARMMGRKYSAFDFLTPPANKKVLRPRPMRGGEEPTQGVSRVCTMYQLPPQQPTGNLWMPFQRSSPRIPLASLSPQQQQHYHPQHSWESSSQAMLHDFGDEYSLPKFPKF